MNLAANLARTAEAHPTRPAVTLDESVLPYGMLAAGAARVAGWLTELGVQPGDRVAVTMPNIPHMPVVYYGILWAGGVVVPLNPLFKSREFAYALKDSESRVFFAWDGVAEEAGKGAAEAGSTFISVVPAEFLGAVMAHEPVALVDRDAQDTAVVLYTSGTTGAPKGAELTHANMTRNAEISVGLVSVGLDDVVFGGLPLFHSFGQTVAMNAAVSVGANLTLIPRFEPTKALEVLQRDKVTILLAVPTMYVALLQHPNRADYDLSALRVCGSGGASMPVEVLRGFEEAFDAHRSSRATDCPRPRPVASFNHPDRERKPGSIGTPVAGVEMPTGRRRRERRARRARSARSRSAATT